MKVLTTNDNSEWHETLNNFNIKDVNYLPEYLEIYEQENKKASFMSFGGQGLLFLFGDSRNAIIYPFFKRRIADLSFIGENMKDMYDIISPYGYGGPISVTKDSATFEELWGKYFIVFDNYCQQNNIVSEFCRLHPFFANNLPMAKFSNGMIQTVGQIIYVDLSLSEDDIFAQMLKGHRRRIRKAVNNPDLRFETEITDNGPQIFYDIYTENMQRIQAHKKYFFSASFFKTAFRSLGKNLNLWQVTYKGDTCAVWITLKGGNLAYTWLSGVKTKYLNSNANNLLIYRSILKLKQEGFNYLIMGGGKSTMRDSLFDFKAGFSPLTKQFYVYKKIHLQQEYNRLIELQNYKGMSGAEFFPAYRLDGEIEDK